MSQRVELVRRLVYDIGMIEAKSISPLGRRRRQIELDTLIRLRWLAVVGQLAAVFTVAYGLEFEVMILPCLAVIGFTAVINVLLQVSFPRVYRLEPPAAAALMALNIAELAALLYFTGGLRNPFAFLFLGPVLISATTLPPRLTLALGIFAMVLAGLLGLYYFKLPWPDDDPLVIPDTYLLGVWLSIGLSIGVTSLYAFQATDQARKLSDALAAAELVLEREQHLTQLDGLAAAAAHELGTPLSTITVIAREIERNAEPDSALAAEIRTLREQATRCRDILTKLSQMPEDQMFDRAAMRALLEEVVEPHRIFDITIDIAPAPDNIGPEPILLRNAAVVHGLGNMVENAVDFARTRVEISMIWNEDMIGLTIADDGPGFPPEILARIGEPYLSRRNRRPHAAPARGSAQGLGLGLFIAKSFLERSGAIVAFANKPFPAHGAIASVTWPREEIDAGAASVPQTVEEI